MSENVAITLALKEKHLEYFDEMAKMHKLPDRSKALRCLVTFAMQQSQHENSIFTEVRCTNC